MERAGFEETLAPPSVGGAALGLSDGTHAKGGASCAAFVASSIGAFRGRPGYSKGQLPALGIGCHGPGSEEYNQRHRHNDYQKEDERRRSIPNQSQLRTSTSKGKTILLP